MGSERRTREARKSGRDDRSRFEEFVETAYGRVSRPVFFLLWVGVIVAWFVSAPLWADLKEWQVATHTVTSVVTLLLLALLENSGRRAEEAARRSSTCLARQGRIEEAGARFEWTMPAPTQLGLFAEEVEVPGGR